MSYHNNTSESNVHNKNSSGKKVKPTYDGRSFETPPRTSSAPPNLAEQEMFQYQSYQPRFTPYNNYYQPQYYGPYPPTPFNPYMTPPTSVKITPPKKSGGLKIRDPSGKVLNPEDLVKDDKQTEVKDESNKDEKKSNVSPGIPQEIPKNTSNKETPSETQDESEPETSEEKQTVPEDKQVKDEIETTQKEEPTKEVPVEQNIENQTTVNDEEKELETSKTTEEIKEMKPEETQEMKEGESSSPEENEESEEDKENEEDEEEEEEEEDEWESTQINVDNNPIQEDKKPKKITYSREELLKFESLYQPTESTRKASEENDLSRTKDEPRREFRGKGPQRGKKSSPFQTKRRNENSLSKFKRPSENRWQRPTGHDDIRLPIRRILNKLTPTLYESLLEKLLEIKLEDFDAYSVLVELIYEKAIKDTKYTEIYARLCKDLNAKFGNLSFDGRTVKFRVLIVNKCAHEFANRASPESIPESITDPIDREEKINKMKDDLNGMMIFIGELYKQSMIGGKHMINCLSELINKDTQYELEIFSSLYRTLGEKVEGEQKHKEMLSEIHKKMEHISKTKDYPPRIRFMFLDLLDLKKNNFVEKKKF